MKSFLELLTSTIPFLAPYSIWIKFLVAFWILLTALVIIFLLFLRPDTDVNINTTSKTPSNKSIESMTIEVRLTSNLKDGAEIPPSEVPFIPVGDAHSYFQGAPGKARLDFKSPVRFRRQDPNKIVVINRFSMETGSVLQHKPLAFLKNYNILSVPVVTVVYGEALEKFTLLEVALTINGADIWYGSYQYDVPFEVGPRFEIPLEQLHKRL